ncbi:MAG TPA: ABC transporter permease [Candidatus Acidoferrales bacterium]|nr:ABC transporter permease [Candidatus Acidoferrales bacterium]
MKTFWHDVVYAVRMLRKSPGFTIVAVLTLVLGIGGNATVFSWIRGVLMNPLPGISHADQWVAAETVMPNGEFHTSSYPDYKDYRDQNHVFSDLICFEFIGADLNFLDTQPSERVWGMLVTENYFDALGVRPELGATFHADKNQALNSDPYIVLSYGLWQRQFGADPNIVGRVVHVNSHPFTVIGVAPQGFYGTIVGVASGYWVPMMMQPQALPGEDIEERTPTFVHIMGRLRPGVTLAQAQAEMSSIAKHLAQENPNKSKNIGIAIAPVWKAHYGVQDFLRSVLGFLMIAAALVLLIGCVNVANLLLSRATSREREMAIRAAMGAGRERLVRLMLSESLVLALAGGAGGVVVALWGVNLLKLFAPNSHLPVAFAAGVDGPVLAFTLILSLATGIVFGLVPAWRASKTDLNQSLKEGGRTAGSGGAHRLRDILVVSEIALATVLLATAGLLIRSLRSAEAAGPGFNVNHVAVAAFDLRGNGYTSERATLFFDQLLERLRALPGVQSASSERYVPLWFTGQSYTFVQVQGYTPGSNENMRIDLNVVGADYFRTTQIPLASGRDFNESDRDAAPKAMIVNQTMANRFWPGVDPVGHEVRLWGEWWTVVGVARDIKYHRMNEGPESFMYLPVLQTDDTDANILVRSDLPAAAVIGMVRDVASSLDAKVQPMESDDLAELLKSSMFANRTAAAIASLLGGLGVFLAALGIYGVLSYTVSQRLREIGVRIALGAQRKDVLRLVVGAGLRLAAIGAMLGAAAALALTREMSSLLFGVSATDPATFVAVLALVGIAAALAAYIPAMRAMRVDPMVALRYE